MTPAPVTVTAISEHPDEPQDRMALIVSTPVTVARTTHDITVGVAVRTLEGWTAGVRAGVFRRRFEYTGHPGAHAAVAAILRSREGRRLGITAWSDVWWSSAAGRAARDAWGPVTAR